MQIGRPPAAPRAAQRCAALSLTHPAAQPTPHPSQVRGLLQQFVNIRRHKIEEGLKMVAQASTIKLTNLSAYEANLIRLNLQGSLNMFLKFSKVGRLAGWTAGRGAVEAQCGSGQRGREGRARQSDGLKKGAGLAATTRPPAFARLRQVEMMLEDRAASMPITPGF